MYTEHFYCIKKNILMHTEKKIIQKYLVTVNLVNYHTLGIPEIH